VRVAGDSIPRGAYPAKFAQLGHLRPLAAGLEPRPLTTVEVRLRPHTNFQLPPSRARTPPRTIMSQIEIVHGRRWRHLLPAEVVA
jgi:hypothetical protein